MALSDFTNPKNLWRIRKSEPPSPCHQDETVKIWLLVTCSGGHAPAAGTYDPESDSIKFPGMGTLTLDRQSDKTEIQMTFDREGGNAGSWTADDTGTTGG